MPVLQYFGEYFGLLNYFGALLSNDEIEKGCLCRNSMRFYGQGHNISTNTNKYSGGERTFLNILYYFLWGITWHRWDIICFFYSLNNLLFCLDGELPGKGGRISKYYFS